MYVTLPVPVKESYLLFDKIIYYKSDDVIMRSPMDFSSAKCLFSHYEKKWIDFCPREFKSNLYKSFFDENFLMISSKTHSKMLGD